MKKQEYIKPAMQVVKIQQTQMLCSSPGAKTLTLPGGEGLIMPEDGILGDDDDDN